MFHSVNNGGGTMAQFSIPELGSGQWMKGGMTMCGDMFNTGLQNMVSNLCTELSNLLATTQVLAPPPKGTNTGMGGQWWPTELGSPNSSGGQNGTQYAYFAQASRLAVNHNGQVSVYDTLDHQIGGVQQQQGGGSSVTFTSQYGTVDPINLPLISGNSISQPDAPTPQASALENVEKAPFPVDNAAPQLEGNLQAITASIQQLSDLFNAGVLTEEEFSTKKAELLARI